VAIDPATGAEVLTYELAGTADVDEAVACLERACADRNALTWWIRDCPFYDPIRSHPRFPALLEKIVPA